MWSPDREVQRRYWSDADERHLRWQLGDSFFGRSERALIETACAGFVAPVLEIGCGEGANLAHLGGRGHLGCDFSTAKVRKARRLLPGCGFFTADAESLPVAGNAVPSVLIRDLLHHVTTRARVLAEAMRVLQPGGRVAVVEPNRNSPLIVAQALLVPAERGVLVSTRARLEAELRATGFIDVAVTHVQPLPVARVISHPRLGLSAALDSRFGDALFAAADFLAERMVPRSAWMYLVATGRKPRNAP